MLSNSPVKKLPAERMDDSVKTVVSPKTIALGPIINDGPDDYANNGSNGLIAGSADTKKTNWLLWGGIILAVAGIAYGTWYYYKKAKK